MAEPTYEELKAKLAELESQQAGSPMSDLEKLSDDEALMKYGPALTFYLDEVEQVMEIFKSGDIPAMMAFIQTHLLELSTFRIFTEDKNREGIESIMADEQFNGFTMIPASGYWHGQREASLMLEVVTHDRERILNVARRIRLLNDQQAVLVQSIQMQAELVHAS